METCDIIFLRISKNRPICIFFFIKCIYAFFVWFNNVTLPACDFVTRKKVIIIEPFHSQKD